MSRRDRFDPPPPWTGAGIALATLMAVLAAYLLAAWLDCSSGPGTALCGLPMALHWRPAMPRWVLRLRLRWARRRVQRCKAAQLRQAGLRIEREAVVIDLESRLRQRGCRP